MNGEIVCELEQMSIEHLQQAVMLLNTNLQPPEKKKWFFEERSSRKKTI